MTNISAVSTWRRIDLNNLPDGAVLATDGTEYIIGSVFYDEDEDAVYCEQLEGNPIKLYDPTHYILMAELKLLPKE